MISRTICSLLLATLMLTLVATAAAVPSHATKRKTGAKVVSAAPSITPLATAPSATSSSVLTALPASDAIMFIDASRLMTDLLPNLLAASPAALADATKQLDLLRDKFGVDLQLFDSVAIGMRFAPQAVSASSRVVVARGRFDASAVLDAITSGSAAESKGAIVWQKQQYEGRTIFVAAPHNSSYDSKNAAVGPHTRLDKMNEAGKRRHPGMAASMAATAIDANTLAFGDLGGVIKAIDVNLGGATASRVDEELIALATHTADAIIGFSGKMPVPVAQKLGAAVPPFTTHLAGIRQFYGSASLKGTDAEVLIALRTENADQAQSITAQLTALKQTIKQIATTTYKSEPAAAETNSSPKPSLQGQPADTGAGAVPNVALPGMNRIVAGPLMNVMNMLNNLAVTNQNNEVQIKFGLSSSDLAPLMQRPRR